MQLRHGCTHEMASTGRYQPQPYPIPTASAMAPSLWISESTSACLAGLRLGCTLCNCACCWAASCDACSWDRGWGAASVVVVGADGALLLVLFVGCGEPQIPVRLWKI